MAIPRLIRCIDDNGHYICRQPYARLRLILGNAHRGVAERTGGNDGGGLQIERGNEDAIPLFGIYRQRNPYPQLLRHARQRGEEDRTQLRLH